MSILLPRTCLKCQRENILRQSVKGSSLKSHVILRQAVFLYSLKFINSNQDKDHDGLYFILYFHINFDIFFI